MNNKSKNNMLLKAVSVVLTIIIIGLSFMVIVNYSNKKVSTAVTKPIIYLYPTEESNVTIKLKKKELLTHTYPKYNESWSVLVKPNGDLIDLKTGKSYYSLYWEGRYNNFKIEDYGFVVRGKDTISFLEEKLSSLGLSEREANEFIIYWLPILENSEYNYIRFATTEEMNEIMPLEVNPKPDTIIRVLMIYKPLNKKIKVKEQKITTPERNGFVLVEWGGSEIR